MKKQKKLIEKEKLFEVKNMIEDLTKSFTHTRPPAKGEPPTARVMSENKKEWIQ
jgi:hypothetical protein